MSCYLRRRYEALIGPQGVHLLTGLLRPDARERMSVECALQHPFLAPLHTAYTPPPVSPTYTRAMTKETHSHRCDVLSTESDTVTRSLVTHDLLHPVTHESSLSSGRPSPAGRVSSAPGTGAAPAVADHEDDVLWRTRRAGRPSARHTSRSRQNESTQRHGNKDHTHRCVGRRGNYAHEQMSMTALQGCSGGRVYTDRLAARHDGAACARVFASATATPRLSSQWAAAVAVAAMRARLDKDDNEEDDDMYFARVRAASPRHPGRLRGVPQVTSVVPSSFPATSASASVRRCDWTLSPRRRVLTRTNTTTRSSPPACAPLRSRAARTTPTTRGRMPAAAAIARRARVMRDTARTYQTAAVCTTPLFGTRSVCAVPHAQTLTHVCRPGADRRSRGVTTSPIHAGALPPRRLPSLTHRYTHTQECGFHASRSGGGCRGGSPRRLGVLPAV